MFLETERLIIRKARESDSSLIYSLWTDPRVMANVGFPKGLKISESEIIDQISEEAVGDSLLESLLVVELSTENISIGQCIMHKPNKEGISTTDIKLLPKYWGKGYGAEIKRCLIKTLFVHTDCLAVEATPNVNNTASIRMQESVGGRRVGEEVYEFPESMSDFTTPVHHYIYRVSRSDWEGSASGLELRKE